MKIESLFEDSTGTLWIGTHARGIAKYGGDDFSWYTTRNGLSGNGVFGIGEDHEGALWLSTDGGLCRWGVDGFEAVGEASGLSFLWGVAADAVGNLWFGAERRSDAPPRACRWDGKELVTIDLDSESGSRRRSIHSIVVDGEGRIWCGGHGLYVVDDYSVRAVLKGSTELEDILSIAVTADDTLLVAAMSGTYELVGEELRGVQGLDSHVEGLRQAPDGSVWAATRDGKLLRMLKGQVTEIGNLNVPLWRALSFDRMGRLWVGSYGFGLFCYDETRVRITDGSRGLPDGKVQAIACRQGELWIGTPNGLVTAHDGKLWDLSSRHEDYANENVTALLADSRGRLWIAKRNGYVYLLEGGRLTRCAEAELIIRYTIDSMAEDGDGTVWVASSFAGGVGRYTTPEEVQCFELRGAHEGSVGAIARGPSGSVYLGSSSPRIWDGVVEFDGGSFRSVEGIAGGPVTALCFDGSGRLWVGTTEGISVCDGQYVLAYGLEDGLPSELITALYTDTNSRVWIGTEGGGVCVFDGQVFQSLHFDDRPFCNTVNDICEDQKGDIWLATNGGLIHRSLKTAGVTTTIDEVVADTTYPSPTEVQFPDTVGRITIAFRGASETDRAEHLVYRYQLKGYDSDWRQTRDREVDYPRLEPGEYEFVVEAVDRDLNYSKPESAKLAVIADPRIDALNQALRAEGARGDFVGESRAMQDVLQQVREVAWTDLTVLVLGETGTGKGLAAQQIHELSERRDGPFIHINCGSLQEGLVDSELFGHERGAFTGAVSRRLGKFELAQGGTIFLDEIGDLPVESQARLLKVLQDKTIERVGGTQTISVNVRVIAATNRNLTEAVREQKYRADLYYRLNVFPIRMPALRERREDTPRLAEHFVRTFAAHLNLPAPQLTEEAMSVLLYYDWPGNVRELEHTLQRAVILAHDGEITSAQLGMGQPQPTSATRGEIPIVPLEEFERRYFKRVLEHTGGVIHGKHGAARLLDMKPTTLRSRLEKLGIRNRKSRRSGG